MQIFFRILVLSGFGHRRVLVCFLKTRKVIQIANFSIFVITLCILWQVSHKNNFILRNNPIIPHCISSQNNNSQDFWQFSIPIYLEKLQYLMHVSLNYVFNKRKEMYAHFTIYAFRNGVFWFTLLDFISIDALELRTTSKFGTK